MAHLLPIQLVRDTKMQCNFSTSLLKNKYILEVGVVEERRHQQAQETTEGATTKNETLSYTATNI